MVDNTANTPSAPALTGAEQEQVERVKRQVLLMVWVAAGVICVSGLALIVYSFWSDWPGSAVSDLPLLFWVLYGICLGTFGVTLGVLEFRAWRTKPSTNASQLSFDLLLVTLVIILVFALLTGHWNGTKLVMVSFGLVFVLQGASSIVRRFVVRSRA